ncbi:LTA synthase family protein [Mucilaginibacter sp. UR6-11]|uniref:LTA synthase family protein n=1 Tax=Mucilaginibacter sp. UR6-11 TaxID=1435644 RepID=UPI001E2DE761|nr:alkaline phosphatase family protein [Mucilaginibacter sp. UR6-11]MCC8426223.1 sulfatase-like hydrolase/transferase [Mucilaginibacter sp. UR6-11]
MLRSLYSFIRFYIFWLLFFALTRATFEIYFRDKLRGTTNTDILKTYLYGIRMDASATAYIAVIPLLIFLINWFIANGRIKSIWLKVYTWFCLFCISLIAVVDLGIFAEWGAKVNFRAFDTLYNSPAESMSSTASSPIALHLTIMMFLLVTGVVFSHYILDHSFKKPVTTTRNKIIALVLLTGTNFMLLRGSLSPDPINQSAGYFSDNQLLDLSAQNTEWNLFNNVFENLRKPYNPYLFLPAAQAKTIAEESFKVKKDTTLQLLNTQKPNVVIIQLESFTADVIASLGGEKGVAPNFENFIKNGVLFDSIYAAGDRTDKGIIAILSGFPSQAIRTIVVDTPKQKQLPSLMTEFKNNGYNTSYFYGGNSDYMNFGTYMADHRTDYIMDAKVMKKEEIGTTWGAYDNVLLDKHIAYLSKQTKPFFSLIQTSTNHEPFLLPGAPHFKGKTVADQFRSTAWFTDSCLNAYFEEAKKHEWYKNTLFILVADHGHRLPKSTAAAFDPAKYHIPLLFFGDAIKPEYRGTKITKLGNQTDLAATVLAQLNLSPQKFKWSKNLLNPYAPAFAFFDWDNGFGFMTPEQSVSYDSSGQRIIYRKNKNANPALTEKTLLTGKAFMQQIFTEYLAY